MKDTIVLYKIFGGVGTKALQAYLSDTKNILSIPGYPLIYLFSNYEFWKKKYKNLTHKNLVNLILKQHKSLVDSSKIKGFNGLTSLGKKQNKCLKINERSFKKNLIKNLKDKKKINEYDLINAIHLSYFKTQNKNIKNKLVLFHVHEFEFFAKYYKKYSKKVILLICIREPIENFWRRIYAHSNLEKVRFDCTDQFYLENHAYINNLKNFTTLDLNWMDEDFKKRKKIIFKYDNFKKNLTNSLKKLSKKIGIKFERKMVIPTANGELWNSDKIYQGSKSLNQDKVNSKKFFFHEKFVLGFLFNSFYKKFKYNHLIKSESLVNYLIFFILIFLPTKFGIKRLLILINPITFIKYTNCILKECFNKKHVKNYYFNSMYKHKWAYRNKFLIKKNIFRKNLYFNHSNILNKISYFMSKIIIYFFALIEVGVLLYLLRIYILIKSFFGLRKIFKKLNFSLI